jgi:hypothetical protein
MEKYQFRLGVDNTSLEILKKNGLNVYAVRHSGGVKVHNVSIV